MHWRVCLWIVGLGGAWLGREGCAGAAEVFRVGTYNMENYLLEAVGTRVVKPPEARAKVRESLRALNADVVALQEVGGTNALLELRRALRAEGLDYPHWELVTGWDTNIQVAVLSQFPIVARRPHTNDSFLLLGRRFRVSRGFLEVDIRINPRYAFTLFTTHLKSRRVVPEADEAELREQEALLLRQKIDARLAADPDANIIVLGDFNDVKDSRSTRAVFGRGRNQLFDTRPAERNGDDQPNPNPRFDPRNITWTHYYGKEDTYSRIDYILLSRGMTREWLKEETQVLTSPNWGVGSDHRPIVAGFVAEERP
jgi:endonuclease/exonuclease/phosphatase family metal-dependent hydrolase